MKKYMIEQVENGYIIHDQNTSCFPKQYVFEQFLDILNFIGYPLGELELDEKFVLTKEKE